MEKILLVILLGLHLSMGHFRIPWHPKLRTNKYKQLKPFRPSPKISDSSWKISYYHGKFKSVVKSDVGILPSNMKQALVHSDNDT